MAKQFTCPTCGAKIERELQHPAGCNGEPSWHQEGAAGVEVTIMGTDENAFSFWYPKTIEELAKQQDVKPVDNIEQLYGSWPGDCGDNFEGFIDELRNAQLDEHKQE